MVRSRLSVLPVERFVFRTPLLPFAELTSLGDELRAPDEPSPETVAHDTALLRRRMREQLERPEVRDALGVASPDLDRSLERWAGEPDTPRGIGVERALVRYLSRMASRPTPFGLFAGVSVGRIAEATDLCVDGRGQYRRSTRLDNDYLFALAEALNADPAIRAELSWWPNSSLYRAAGRLRYAEARLRGRDRSYHLVAVEPSEYLEATLARAEGGATCAELARALVDDDPEIQLDEAEGFVDELIDSQILVSSSSPAVTGRQPAHEMVDQLRALDAAREPAEHLGRAVERIEAIDRGGLGARADAYREVADILEPLPPEVDLRRLFQVDMVKPSPDAVVSQVVVDEVLRGVAVLHRMGRPDGDDALRRFVEDFGRRYESREVPLVEVLDEETGIGFQSSRAPGAEASPLLEGLPFPGRPSGREVPWGRREQHLLSRLQDVSARGATELPLSRGDLDALSFDAPTRLPDAFSTMVELAARSAQDLERGRFRVLMGGGGGPSGARLSGRFCHASEGIDALVRSHLRDEEALDPGAIHAEIVHLPEGRIGNILCRPVLRDYEIPYLGRSGASPDRQIPVQDLMVSVSGGRVVLRSRRLGKRVIPRLTTAHNYGFRSQGIYRFLCALQSQGSGGFGWSWGPLDAAPFLPRVSSGRLVFARARWRLDADELRALSRAARGAKKVSGAGDVAALRARVFDAVCALRQRRGLPRWVVLADGDNELPVDLDNVLSVDSFVQTVKSRSRAVLTELWPGPEELVARGPEGSFASELVFSFVANREPREEPVRPPGAGTIRRRFPVGSEWMFAKIYTGTATADDVLREAIAPLVLRAIRSGAADRWFFLRYGDPDWHVRVRLRGAPERLYSECVPQLHAALEPFVETGAVWKVALDTYEREVERYGGPEGMEPSEEAFWADSEAVAGIVDLLSGDEGADARWRLAARGAHLVMADFGLDLDAMHRLMTRLRDGFGREFGMDTGFQKRLGARFRAEQDELVTLVEPDPARDAASPLAPGFELLDQRSRRNRAIAAELSRRQLTTSRPELVSSYIHMHLNRLLRSAQRAHELVLYDLLRRTYASLRARRS